MQKDLKVQIFEEQLIGTNEYVKVISVFYSENDERLGLLT